MQSWTCKLLVQKNVREIKAYDIKDDAILNLEASGSICVIVIAKIRMNW